MARYAQIDIAFADEGRYIGRREEDAVIMIFSLVYTYGSQRAEASRVRWLTRENGGTERELNVETYSAMWWFCTRQTSSRLGRWN